MKFKDNKLISITIGILGPVWVLGILIFAGMREPAIEYNGSLLFGIVAVLITLIYLLFIRVNPGRQAAEQGDLSVIATVAYFLTSLIANTLMIPFNLGGFNRYLVILNIILVAVYLVVILYVEAYNRRLKNQLDTVETKKQAVTDISGKLGALLGAAKDAEVRKRLLKLKEEVDYGSNISTAATAGAERQMAGCLDELMSLLMADSREELIMEKIGQAERCWKTRNSSASLT